MNILFVTDYVCPYCILAKEALRRALEITGIEAKITYQPLLLKPKPPVKFNPDDPAVIKRFELLSSAARALDIDECGRLVVKSEHGIERLNSGEVSLRLP